MKKTLLFIAVAAFCSCNSNKKSFNSSDSAKMVDSIQAALKTVTDSSKKTASKPEESTTGWKYETDTDKMTSKLKYFASATSTNTLNFAAPYDGGSTATISFRYQNGENNVILNIDKGQFICDVSEGCPIKVRFDNAPAMKLSATEPSDYSSTALFIDPANKVIMNAKKAKKMIVEAQFYEEGFQDMEFDVEGLKWDH